MGVSRNGFYDHLSRRGREPSKCEQGDVTLLNRIIDIFEASGKRPPYSEVRKLRVVCSLKWVKRLTREAGIYVLPKRKFERRKTTEALLETTNLLIPKPDLAQVNQVWYSDITFVKIDEGWELGPLGARRHFLTRVSSAAQQRSPGFARSSFIW